MPLQVVLDHDAIRALLDRAVAADPVGGTVLGTIAMSLEDGAWCASGADRIAVRSGTGFPLALAGTWDDTAVAELADLVRDVPRLRAVSGPDEVAGRVAAAVFRDRSTVTMEQLLFRLDELVEPSGVAGTARLATDDDRVVVREWYAAFEIEADAVHPGAERAADRALDGGHCYLWCDPRRARPVSLASRRPAVGGSARVGPVYTPLEHRRNGYGAAVTAAATRSILAEGAVPVLFTDLANPTSNRIYQEIGYRPVERRRVIRLS